VAAAAAARAGKADSETLQRDRTWNEAELRVLTEAIHGERNFFSVARYKWELAAAVLAEGLPVLVSDPDITFLRNPHLYLASGSIPECDLTFQTELGGVFPMLDPRISQAMGLGLQRYVRGTGHVFNAWVNSGFFVARPRNATRRLVDVLRTYFPLSDGISFRDPHSGQDRARGDQSILAMLLGSQYAIQAPEGSSSGELDELWAAEQQAGQRDPSSKLQARYARDSLQRNQCMRLRRAHPLNSAARRLLPGHDDPLVRRLMEQLPDELSIWLLSPALFPTYPVLSSSEACMAMLERPYMVHYNWMKGVETKVDSMKLLCHWWDISE
jgi:hypothetical protein